MSHTMHRRSTSGLSEHKPLDNFSGSMGMTRRGKYTLVAIADVSHYVENGSAIDIDAYERATSVYFPRRVIPMLPEKLSNGLCSLNPEVERLCMVCDMLVSATGEIYAYQFYPGVMWSHARFTYLSLIHISEPTRRTPISYAVF